MASIFDWQEPEIQVWITRNNTTEIMTNSIVHTVPEWATFVDPQNTVISPGTDGKFHMIENDLQTSIANADTREELENYRKSVSGN